MTKLKAGSQNGAADKRQVGGAGGEDNEQAAIQAAESHRHDAEPAGGSAGSCPETHLC